MIAVVVITAAAPADKPDVEGIEIFVPDESVFCADNSTFVEMDVVLRLVMVVNIVLGNWVMISVRDSVNMIVLVAELPPPPLIACASCLSCSQRMLEPFPPSLLFVKARVLPKDVPGKKNWHRWQEPLLMVRSKSKMYGEGLPSEMSCLPSARVVG